VRLLGCEGPDTGVAVIDPTRRAYAAREVADRPKKLLALDGGGIRGALSLEFLRTLEQRLREHYHDKLVLADYFDYIGGTSTGAIIAAGLALGKEVEELQAMYRDLGKKIFSKRSCRCGFARSTATGRSPTRSSSSSVRAEHSAIPICERCCSSALGRRRGFPRR
jgi:predicted acylesterase/phospholipase RssA